MSTGPFRDSLSSVNFGVSARLVAILGRHLIRDNTVGLIELIKNGYDADANLVTVEMLGLSDPADTKVIVQDDGDGMTRDIITGPWLTVAHGHKEANKQQAWRSARGRIPLGEKGVGRFAAHKLGRHLMLVTRPRGHANELVVEIDWDDFEATDGSLSDVPVRLTERAPRTFTALDAHGTRLEMTRARDKWQPSDMERLQGALIRMTNPRFGVSDFKVQLSCPDYPDLERLEEYDVTDRFQFRLDCRIEADGTARWEYRWRNAKLEEELDSGVTSFWEEERLFAPPACGPLSIEFCAWLAREKTLNGLGVSRKILQQLAGVSIYRDGFRILPYGDEGDDWLGLDSRRINNPTVRFGNRQIIGSVATDQVRNRALVDKTNREGLQENQAFHDLKKLVLRSLKFLEDRSLEERQQDARHYLQTKQKLEENIQRLDTVVKTITTVRGRAPAPADSESVQDPDPVQETKLAPAQPAQVVLDLEQVQDLARTAQELRDSAAQVAEYQDDERDAYLRLIGYGLAAERFTHEMDRQISRARDACDILRNKDLPPEAALAARQLHVFVNSLRNELRVMGQLRYVRRAQRAREVSVRDISEFLLLAYDDQFTRLNIKVDPWLQDDFAAFMSEASVAQVIDNILDNAIYWLSKATPQGGRRLRVDLDPEERAILICNNGPALDPLVRGRLFTRPFVTAKDDGHGLGMYLSEEIMRRAGGHIALLPDDECTLDGPGFIVRFPANPKDTEPEPQA